MPGVLCGLYLFAGAAFLGAVFGFCFEGGVVNVEVFECVSEVGFEGCLLGLGECGIDEEVCGEGVGGGAHGPDVDVVDVLDARGFSCGDFYFLNIDVGGDAIYGEAEAVFEEACGAGDDDDHDDEADYRIEPVPVGVGDDDACCDDSDGYEGVGGHVEVGSFHVEVVVFAAHE